jgi:hypothetical protein
MYAEGQGVPQDLTQAVIWLRRAAEQGIAPAQNTLGGLYYYGGRGVPQDYTEAYFWFDVAVSGKPGESLAEQTAKYRDEAASHLAPTVLAREQERARKWFEAHRAKPQ